MLPRFTWQDYEDATSFSPVGKPELIIDERLVRECQESEKPPKWEAPPQSSEAPKQDKHRSKGEYKKREKVTVEEPIEEVIAESAKAAQSEQEPVPEQEEEQQSDDTFGAAPS